MPGTKLLTEEDRAQQFIRDAIPAEFSVFDPALCPCIEAHNQAIAICRPIDMDDNGNLTPGYKGGILFHGPTGTGKTRAAFAMLREWIKEDCWMRFRYASAPTLKHQLADAARTGRSKQVIDDLLTDNDVLFLDDLSQARFSASFAENLFEIVDRVYRNHREIVVTCQGTGHELVRKWCADDRDLMATAEAIARRLKDYCVPVRFGKSLTVQRKSVGA